MQDVMFDLETYGLKPGCAIRSIGAVFFDIDGKIGKEFYANITLESCIKRGLTVEPDTLLWWLKQEAAAQAALQKDPLPLDVVAGGFHHWFMANGGKRIWCQGAAFDVPVWEHAVGKVPWKYNDVRDTRTLYDIADYLQVERPAIARTGVYHNALHDAEFQVECLVAALNLLQQ